MPFKSKTDKTIKQKLKMTPRADRIYKAVKRGPKKTKRPRKNKLKQQLIKNRLNAPALENLGLVVPTTLKAVDSAISKKEFLKQYALRMDLAASASAAGVVRKTVINWIAIDADFKAAMDDIKEAVLDKCEGNVYIAAARTKQPHLGMSQYVLEQQAKHRGWNPDKKVDVGGTLKLEVVRKVLTRESIQQAKDEKAAKTYESPHINPENVGN